MDTEDVISHARALIAEAEAIGAKDGPEYRGVSARACDFLTRFAGPKSSFTKAANDLVGSVPYRASSLAALLQAFITHLEVGLVEGLSPKRQAELDVVSDFLEQANALLEAKQVHPAAPAVLIGATLEEFLRTWCEAEGISLGAKKLGLDSYAKSLREAELISKQDVKDITSWSGVRNHAAHGEWEELGDKQRIKLMLEGVNLFMRRYAG